MSAPIKPTGLYSGAREIARISSANGRTWVMACRSQCGCAMPYVTWEIDPVHGACYWGHYFADHDSAAADLIDRAVL